MRIESQGRESGVTSTSLYMRDVPDSSAALNASTPSLGFANAKGPFAGVPVTKREDGPATSVPVDVLSAASEELRALFHCLTSSTA